jgi:hypothetical protein
LTLGLLTLDFGRRTSDMRLCNFGLWTFEFRHFVI